MNIDRETCRWEELGIINAEQRAEIMTLYEGGLSLAVLGVLWFGGALVFLGIAFLLNILWDDLGVLRSPVTLGLAGSFFAGGWALMRQRPELEKTAMALLVIGGLLLPGAMGITWEELFGSSGHLLPLVAVCGTIYAVLAYRLKSRAFSALFCAALFFAGEEVIRDRSFGVLFPMVELGLVRSLEDVFPLVYFSLAGPAVVLAFLCGRSRDYAHLRPTLLVCALLLALLPALVGGLMRPYKELKIFLSLAACVGGMGLSIVLGERKAFWVGGGCLALGLLILFKHFYDGSVAFTLVAILVGLLAMGFGSYMAFQKESWLDRLFQRGAAAASLPPPLAGDEPVLATGPSKDS